MRLGIVKAEFYIRIASIILAGLGFLTVLFAISLTGRAMPVEGVVGTSLLIAFAVHLLLRASFTKFDPKNWERKVKLDRVGEMARTIGGAGAYFSIVRSVMGMCFLVGFFWFFLRYGVLRGDVTFVLTSSFYIILGTLIGYALLLRPVVNKLGSLAVTKNVAFMPSYEIVNGGVVLDLNLNFIGKKPASAPDGKVRIDFKELDEVKAFELQEAKQYVDFEIGPDVRRGWQEISGEVQYMMGKIPRPRAYFKLQSGGKTLVLRGSDVLYVITVSQNDCSDLISAFEASRR